ncbi:tyrosine-type recombinase/integrase [Clostridium oryzae]|uniref:Tyrosine recombinase XerC n=1 Tax=Clostridium oryzae TaxID=1450648 RepID=A0A1V4IVM9_9CLOT|nr:tyrosine-type recombinase/integrase [Clostridium oryzae]OPJ63467.1 tyrosine recombinase XerC [Clostridium oryzae]
MPKAKIKLNNSNGLRPDALLDRLKEKSISITDFFKIYNDFIVDKQLERLSSRTLKDYSDHINFFKVYINEEIRSSKDRYLIDSKLFKDYLSYMIVAKQYKPCTVNLRISTLKCYLNWLYEKKYTNENYSLCLKKVKVPIDTIQPLNNTEIKKIINVIDTGTYAGLRDFTMLIIMLDCGIRIQELSNVKIEDIDVKNRILKVNGITAKTRIYRELPLSKDSINLLKQMIQISKDNNSEYVFLSSQTGEKIDHDVVIKNFGKYGKKAGITHRATPHVFRHAMAVNAIKNGMDVFTLQKILGHSSIQTTRKYIQLNIEDLIKTHNKIDLLSKILK